MLIPAIRNGEYTAVMDRADAVTYSRGVSGSQFTDSLEEKIDPLPSSKSIPESMTAEVRPMGRPVITWEATSPNEAAFLPDRFGRIANWSTAKGIKSTIASISISIQGRVKRTFALLVLLLARRYDLTSTDESESTAEDRTMSIPQSFGYSCSVLASGELQKDVF